MNATSPDQLFADYLRHGAPERFAELHDLLREELTRAAERLAPNRDAAEDLVQATFLGALESAGRFDPARRVAPWLVGILQNQARMARWRARRSPEPGRLQWPEPRDPAEVAADRELERTLADAMARLGPVYAPVMELHLRDVPAQEIGAVLSRPAGTVRTQVVRGTALLRSLLPSGIASLLLVRATPGLDGAGVRALLVERTARGRIAIDAVPLARAWWLAAAGIAALGVAWLALPARRDRVPTPPLASTQLDVRTVDSGTPPQASVAAATAGAAPDAAPRTLVAEAASAELVVHVAHGGVPAANAPVVASQFPDSRFARHAQSTDSDGVARFAGLTPGQWIVAASGDLAERIDLGAGESREVRTALSTVLMLAGRAVDEHGAPVAHASVWLCDGDYERVFGYGARRVATADGAGNFELVATPQAVLGFVQVTAPGRRASTLQPMPRERSETRSFVLGPAGAAVAGWVADRHGRPLAGVLVRAVHAGERSQLSFTTADGSFAPTDRHGAVREVRSDAAGQFVIDGFDAGRPVAVTAWEAQWSRHAEVTLAGSAPLAIVLQAGATIRGRVTDADGKAVRDARVATEPERDDPMTAHVYTDAEGRFELPGVTPGEAIAVTATSLPDPIDGSGGAGNATAILRLEPGRTHEWNPVLTPGHVFRGTLALSDGSTLEGWRFDLVAIDPVAGTNHFPVRLDERGEFLVRNVPPSRYWLRAEHDHCDLLQYTVQWPLAERVEVVVPVAIARAAMRYFAEFRSPRPPTGALEVRGVEPGAEVGFDLFAAADDGSWERHPNGPQWRAERACSVVALAPGRYQLSLLGRAASRDALAVANQVLDLTIVGAQTTSLQIVRQHGVERRFRIDEPSPHLVANGALAEVHDAAGQLVSRGRCVREHHPAPGTFEAAVVLTPGRYRISVETDLGQRGALDFTVDALTSAAEALPLPVR